jgi:hypothetical protein
MRASHSCEHRNYAGVHKCLYSNSFHFEKYTVLVLSFEFLTKDIKFHDRYLAHVHEYRPRHVIIMCVFAWHHNLNHDRELINCKLMSRNRIN